MQCILQWPKIWRRQIRTIGGMGEHSPTKFGDCLLGLQTCVRTDIVVLNQHVSWIPARPHSPVTLFQFLGGFDVRVRIDCLTPGLHLHQNHSISVPKDGDHDLSSGRSCLELPFSWWLRMMPLHWLSFRLLPIMVSPSFVICDDPGQKGLPLSIKTLQQFRRDGISLTSVLGCETSRNPSCAYLRISQSANNCHCTSIANWKLYGQLPTCDAPIRMNNAIGALHHVWAGGCGRTPRPQSIMQLRFSTSWSLNSLNPASNGAPIDCTTSVHSTQPFVNVPHTFFLRH